MPADASRAEKAATIQGPRPLGGSKKVGPEGLKGLLQGSLILDS